MMRSLSIFALMGVLFATSVAATEMNPIRKIVTLMQDMQKEIEAEGEKEKGLYDNFMCFCQTGEGDLASAIENAQAKVEELSSKLESETAEKSQIDQELKDHKADRASAKSDVEEATAIRDKEKAEYEAVAADSATNIKALSAALPALEKGMGASALLQMQGGSRLQKIVERAVNLDQFDREAVVAFLQNKGDYAPQSGQIVGIMKQMLEEMIASSKEADADEAKAAASFGELTASKQKEIDVATGAIESKTVRTGELAVSIVQTQDGLDDSKEEVADNQKTLANLKVQCVEKTKEFQVRSKLRAEEVAAISEAIAILNDDDALDVFNSAGGAAASSAFVQTNSVGFLQAKHSKASAIAKAHTIIAGAADKYDSTPLALIAYNMKSQIKQGGKTAVKTQNFRMILDMIDKMMVILQDEQAEDDAAKANCEKEFDQASSDEEKHKDKIAGLDATVTEMSDSIETLNNDVATLKDQVKELDKSVAQATQQRKLENAQYTEAATMNEAAMGLLDKAKNRLNKFYNPTLYKEEPVKELSQEDAIYVSAGREEFAGFAQVNAHSHSKSLEAPETFSGIQQPKREKSTGVIALMDQMMGELSSDMKAAKYDEEAAQKEYEELMDDSALTRTTTTRSITDKEGSVAELETKINEAKESKALSVEALEDVGLTVSHLHQQCDFLLQNYDARKEARTNEGESLKNGKAVLSGAKFD